MSPQYAKEVTGTHIFEAISNHFPSGLLEDPVCSLLSQNRQINDLGKDANKENCLQGAELMEIHFKGKAWHKPQLGLPEPEFRSVTVVTPAWSSGRLTHQKWAKKYFKYYAKDKVFAKSSANFSATRARQSKYGLMRKSLGLDN